MSDKKSAGLLSSFTALFSSKKKDKRKGKDSPGGPGLPSTPGSPGSTDTGGVRTRRLDSTATDNLDESAGGAKLQARQGQPDGGSRQAERISPGSTGPPSTGAGGGGPPLTSSSRQPSKLSSGARISQGDSVTSNSRCLEASAMMRTNSEIMAAKLAGSLPHSQQLSVVHVGSPESSAPQNSAIARSSMPHSAVLPASSATNSRLSSVAQQHIILSSNHSSAPQVPLEISRLSPSHQTALLAASSSPQQPQFQMAPQQQTGIAPLHPVLQHMRLSPSSPNSDESPPNSSRPSASSYQPAAKKYHPHHGQPPPAGMLVHQGSFPARRSSLLQSSTQPDSGSPRALSSIVLPPVDAAASIVAVGGSASGAASPGHTGNLAGSSGRLVTLASGLSIAPAEDSTGVGVALPPAPLAVPRPAVSAASGAPSALTAAALGASAADRNSQTAGHKKLQLVKQWLQGAAEHDSPASRDTSGTLATPVLTGTPAPGPSNLAIVATGGGSASHSTQLHSASMPQQAIGSTTSVLPAAAAATPSWSQQQQQKPSGPAQVSVLAPPLQVDLRRLGHSGPHSPSLASPTLPTIHQQQQLELPEQLSGYIGGGSASTEMQTQLAAAPGGGGATVYGSTPHLSGALPVALGSVGKPRQLQTLSQPSTSAAAQGHAVGPGGGRDSGSPISASMTEAAAALHAQEQQRRPPYRSTSYTHALYNRPNSDSYSPAYVTPQAALQAARGHSHQYGPSGGGAPSSGQQASQENALLAANANPKINSGSGGYGGVNLNSYTPSAMSVASGVTSQGSFARAVPEGPVIPARALADSTTVACTDRLRESGLAKAAPNSKMPTGAQGARTKTIAVATHCPEDILTQQWTIEDFTLLKKLYEGNLSVVCQAVHKRSGRHVALKIYKRSRLHEMERFQLAREICLHIRILHPSIVSLYAAWKDSKYVYLALEWAPRGNLFEYLVSQGGKLREEDVALTVIKPLMSALAFLHAQQFIHRDVKLENVILDASGAIKLADFGLAIDEKFEQANTRLGTFGYFAPEVLDCPLKKGPFDFKDMSLKGYSSKVDVWSAGVVAYELLTGRAPFSAANAARIIEAIRSRPIEFPPELSADARDFLSQALSRDPEARATAQNLVVHPWIKRLELQVHGPAPNSRPNSNRTSRSSR